MTGTSPSATALDLERIRRDFPILRREVNGRPLVYLDNAASSQKPQAVIDAIVRFYSDFNANIHRGVHQLSVEATTAYEDARAKVQRFLNAPRHEEIVFLRGTTEAVNLVARSYGHANVEAGDEIIISNMEHHSNIVPWQLLCEETGAKLRVVPISDRGEFLLDEYEGLFTARTKLVSTVHVSNALGTVNPVREIVSLAHDRGVPVMLDGAQAAPHMPIDVQAIGCDFYAISGHKMFGPTGIGALYARYDLLEGMPPYQGGGEMIESVTLERSTYNAVPHKFEAGTPDIAGAIGLGATVDYLDTIGLDAIAAHERDLLEYGTRTLSSIDGLRMIGTAPSKAAVFSFVMDEVPAYDIGVILDQQGIAVRTGHHCAEPVMHRFGLDGTVRASFAFYNTRHEIDALADGLRKVRTIFGLA